MKNKEVILVTGGTGFVGCNMVRRLVPLGYRVAALGLHDASRSKIVDLKGDITFFKLNLLDASRLEKTLKVINPSLIIHLASNTNPDRSPKTIKQMMKDNFETTLNLCHTSLALKNLRGIITFGSVGEYEQGPTPFVETQREMPASPYSFSKMCVTYLSAYFHRVHGLPIVMVRPSVLYGEYQTNHQLIPSLIRACLVHRDIPMTEGEQVKDFIYVQDLTSATLKIIERMLTKKKGDILGEIINLCTGRKIKMKEVALLIKKETHSKSKIKLGAIPYRKAENMVFYGSNAKAKSLLHWSPQYTFEEGIRNTVTWYRDYLKNSGARSV